MARRTNAQKKEAVIAMLGDPNWTQQEIADKCDVTRETVNRIKRRLESDREPVSKGEPEENKQSNNRPSMPPPTQSEIERDELRQAMSLIKAFPYGGEEVVKLGLTKGDVADLEYISTWSAHGVLASRQ